MTLNKTVIGYGFLVWIIPFLASFAFYDRSGSLQIPYDLFKSIMIVIGSATGSYLLVRLFKQKKTSKLNGLNIGILWFVINILLDLAILVPMAKMGLSEYFQSIGLRYTTMIISAWAIGAVRGK